MKSLKIISKKKYKTMKQNLESFYALKQYLIESINIKPDFEPIFDSFGDIICKRHESNIYDINLDINKLYSLIGINIPKDINK